MNILVVGSSNADLIIKVPRLPAAGETILGGRFIKAAGGKGANQAVAAARAGGNVSLVARIGNDSFADEAIAGFMIDRVRTDHVYRDDHEATGIAEILVAEDGMNSIAVAPGANAKLSPDDILSAEPAIRSADVLVVQLEIPLDAVCTAVRLASEGHVKVVLNPAPARELPDYLLEQVSILTPNETEAELLTGIAVTDIDSSKAACNVLHEKGVPMVIITLGSKGVFVSTREFSGMLPGYEVLAVDTTAAGDVFNGALAVGIAGKMMLNEAVQFAQAAAALSVTRMGAQPSCPYRKEIEEFISQHHQ